MPETCLVEPPIFVRADEPLLIYSSREAAVGDVEPIDVENGIYTPFDSQGRQLAFVVERSQTTRFRFFSRTIEWVTLVVVEETPNHERLRAELIHVLAGSGPDRASVEDLPMSELQQRAIAEFGVTA